MNDNPLADDLDHVLAQTGDLWDGLRGAKLFITGGTGFFGCWLLETLLWAEDRKGLGVEAVVLTRSPAAFGVKAPHLAHHKAVRLHEGDVRHMNEPRGAFTHVIHAATEATSALNASAPRVTFETIVDGTRRVLDLAQRRGVKRFLLTSSGAVYGRQPSDLTHVGEDYPGAPDVTDPTSAYGEGKRAAEFLAATAYREHGVETLIARCFAFVGPYLPVDAHFAVGNFLRDGLAGEPVKVTGDGTPFRSYQYAADLAAWLWTVLVKGTPARPYNVGSEDDLTVADVAARVASAFDVPWAVSRPPAPGAPPTRYVPSTARARVELGLTSPVAFDDAVRRTVRWHRRGR